MKAKKWFVVVFLLIGTVVFAQTEADFTVTLTRDSAGVVITRYNGRTAAVRIPTTIQGMPVREIGDKAFIGKAAMGNYEPPGWSAIDITSVIIPDGVTTIGETAFGSQRQITSIVIPGTVTNIGRQAFYDCRGLTSITLPDSVTSIGNSAFEGCTHMESIAIPDSVTEIGDRAFAFTALKSINWPSSVTKIQAKDTYGQMGIFSMCVNLQTIVIPEGVTEIGDYSFSGCRALTSVTFPSTIVKIGANAFRGCSALTTVVIPDSVENIQFDTWDGGSFSGCSNLTLASQAALKKRGYTGRF